MPSTLSDNDFIHLEVCIGRLGNCHRTLLDVSRNYGHPLAGPAFQYALVEYCTVFNDSKGADKNRRRLENQMVPDESRALHERIVKARNQQHAHADMSILDGAVEFRQYEGAPISSTIMNHVDPLVELCNLDLIVALVEQVMGNVFVLRQEHLKACVSESPK